MKEQKIILSQTITQKIMQRALALDKACSEHCRDFCVMISPLYKDTLILRWTTIDISDIDRPVQHFRYECFDLKGDSLGCSIHYSNQKEANDFFASLVKLNQTPFAINP